MTAQATVSMSWVNTVLAEAERHGLTRQQLLNHARLQLDQLNNDRWPIDDITRLWRAAVELSQDTGFGLKAGSLVGPASFNVVSFILQSSPSLRDAIGMAQQFQRLISDGGRFQLLAVADKSWVIYHPQQGDLAFSPHQIEAVLAAVVCFSRWVIDRPLVPERVQFSHDQLGPQEGYQTVFQTTVEFNQAFSGILLDNALLDHPLPQADTQLAAMHREYASARLDALSRAPDFLEQVRQWLASNLLHGVPERSAAAQQFGLTDRAFARRLQSQGLSYTDLVDGVRKDAACSAVADTERAFTDIAQSLGFSEASAFNRAFKRWYGYTPGEWRLAGGAPEAPQELLF